nr:immunoglobulin heavy chain junction region [Macaca mulatta]MOW91713.1 immunoglobulin heavy chain junction region [Macaca mulatta]
CAKDIEPSYYSAFHYYVNFGSW